MIKTTANLSAPKQSKEFPKLMIRKLSKDTSIVLFYFYGKGTLLQSSSYSDQLGWYSQDWDMNTFEDYEGEVTIKNS